MSDLVERLRSWVEYGEYSILTESRPERPRNPDGEEAAAAIERKDAALRMAREKLATAGCATDWERDEILAAIDAALEG